MTISEELGEFEIGYFAGLVDGEGYVFMSYSKPDNRTRPNVRIYCTSKSIIEGASKIMRTNPLPRRDKGKLVGWIAAASGGKAVEILRIIGPYLTDPAKKCRALTIAEIFVNRVSITGRHSSAEVFVHCPPSARSRIRQAERSSKTDGGGREEVSRPTLVSRNLRLQTLTQTIPVEKSNLQRGWLCGIVDAEGYIHIRYRSDRDAMYPRLRIFVKSRSIIEAAARLMDVSPYARRNHGKHLGWYASVSHQKALRVLRTIASHLLERSKRCRAKKILDAFGEVGTIHSRLASSEFFGDCPPPSRIREFRRIINGT